LEPAEELVVEVIAVGQHHQRWPNLRGGRLYDPTCQSVSDIGAQLATSS
jgi:hypothetical protein